MEPGCDQLPLRQEVQIEGLEPARVEKVPAVQLVQLEAPGEDQVAFAQARQEAWEMPGPALYLPAAQANDVALVEFTGHQ